MAYSQFSLSPSPDSGIGGLGDKAVYILILTLTSTDACIKCKKG